MEPAFGKGGRVSKRSTRVSRCSAAARAARQTGWSKVTRWLRTAVAVTLNCPALLAYAPAAGCLWHAAAPAGECTLSAGCQDTSSWMRASAAKVQLLPCPCSVLAHTKEGSGSIGSVCQQPCAQGLRSHVGLGKVGRGTPLAHGAQRLCAELCAKPPYFLFHVALHGEHKSEV